MHVVYSNSNENISDAQVQSQIDVLTKDYRRQNSDRGNTPSVFANVAADVNIEFKLACVDPNGNSTSGIRHISTTQTSFPYTSLNGQPDEQRIGIKFIPGATAWPADRYLNIWVCNLTNNKLGYARFPGTVSANLDGVVILYQAFGTIGSLLPRFNKGRTATHEVGHWLNLFHLWGDQFCGDDGVADTPIQQTGNFNCPSFPHISCGNQGDMFMNYMDYTNDECMNLFTNGQKTRMRALFAAGGFRESFVSVKIQEQGTEVCGNVTTFSVSANQGTPVSYNWTVTGALQLASGQGSSQITCNRNGTGVATITVLANGYCDSKTVRVGSPLTPSFTYSESLSPCYGQDKTGNFGTSNVESLVNYNWDIVDLADNSIAMNGRGPSFSFNSASLYPGSFRVTMRASACGGTTATSRTLTIRDCGGGGAFRAATVYPNPADGTVTVEMPSDENSTNTAISTATITMATKFKELIFNVVLYDQYGKQLKSSEKTKGKVQLDVHDLLPGFYYLRISNETDVAYRQLKIVR